MTQPLPIVFISGVNQSLGNELAWPLAQQSYIVIASDRDEGRSENLCTQI